MRAEFDLPSLFLEKHRAGIEAWLETAIPGMVYVIPPEGTQVLAHPAVTSSWLERNTIELRLDLFDGFPLLRPADAASRRLVERAADRLAEDEDRQRAIRGMPYTAFSSFPPSWAVFPGVTGQVMEAVTSTRGPETPPPTLH